jgi:hypothetical protein
MTLDKCEPRNNASRRIIETSFCTTQFKSVHKAVHNEAVEIVPCLLRTLSAPSLQLWRLWSSLFKTLKELAFQGAVLLEHQRSALMYDYLNQCFRLFVC